MRILAFLPLLLLAASALAEDTALLRLESIEFDDGDETWTVENGRIVELSPDLRYQGTFSWIAPPEDVSLAGFDIEVALEAEAQAPDVFYAPIAYLSGPFAFTPDPPQLMVNVGPEHRKDRQVLKAHVTPLRADLAGGTYTLDIGAAYGKAVHYVYRTVPQLTP